MTLQCRYDGGSVFQVQAASVAPGRWWERHECVECGRRGTYYVETGNGVRSVSGCLQRT